MTVIKDIFAREILDSRGNPTLEVDVLLDDGRLGRAAVPSGASTGSLEACELRDNDKSRYNGKGVLTAIANVNTEIKNCLLGCNPLNQSALDESLITIDGTVDKHKLGANAILGVSLAAARAAAKSLRLPLFQYIGENICGNSTFELPVPMFNVLNGGAHADNNIDLQEFMIAPSGASSFREAVRMGSETYHALKSLLKKSGYSTSVGDEGGFAPNFKFNIEALDFIVKAIELAGLKAGKDIVIALDPAASEFYKEGKYCFNKSDKSIHTAEDMIGFYIRLIRDYPIVSIEDGLAEGDWLGWKILTEELGDKIQLVGDDIFVTNPAIIQKAIGKKIGNASLIKLNQIGTLTETIEAMAVSKAAGYGTVISHRSGETPDDFIGDFAVAMSAGQIKTGAPCRGERVTKYNQMMRIEERLGGKASYAGITAFKRKPEAA